MNMVNSGLTEITSTGSLEALHILNLATKEIIAFV